MQGARALVRTLADSGVETIFGLPGDTGMSFYDALHDERERITHVMTRDERSAGFMADVYARVTGRLGVCEGPSGGGATYIVPGVAEAHGSAIPLLCLTSDTPVGQQGRGVLTELDQEGLFRPVAKWSSRVNSAATMAEAARRAIRLATSGRPGATHLSLPTDSLEGETPDSSVYGIPDFGAAPALRTRPDPALAQRAADALTAAARPVIVAGGGVMISGAWDELTELAEALNIPVATSINGKGSIAETSRVAIGVIGGNGARDYGNAFVGDADLIFYVGSRTESTTTCHWTLPPQAGPQQVIQLDVEPWEIGNNYRLVVGLAGDAKLALRDLLAAVDHPERVQARNRPRIEALLEARARYWDEVEAHAAIGTRPIKPAQVVRALRQALDDDAIIVADPGTPTPFLAAQYELRRPGRTTVIPRAHGGLGYAIPGVVGAAFADNGRRVVGMCGDGSFGMSVGELETITRYGLPIVLIQCSNGSFGWIKELQHLYHGDRFFSVDFEPVDYAAIARGFGLRSRQVTDPADVERAIRDALADGGAYFLDIVTESPVTETPPVAAWQDAERRQAEVAGVAAGGERR
ncbi:MAG TPA: thiamine pyrophosphate-binding protein [Thermomicrobiales bacterium]|nr:thiamine pyrophosphate-binding protein [Thermomicrobiales bacterium]